MYAHGIIGVDGSNIAYIRRYSGATVTVQESQGLPDEITSQIKGTPSEVEVAQLLVQVRHDNTQFFLYYDFSKYMLMLETIHGITRKGDKCL